MYSTDPELGQKVRTTLESFGLESPIASAGDYVTPQTREAIEEDCRHMLSCLSINTEDASIKDTPKRVAAMYCDELFYGMSYKRFPKCTLFPSTIDELVMTDNIEVKSMCEHHLIPFIGTCSIGYIPNGRILGLSKFNRVVDFFARRPQVQERLTAQIGLALKTILDNEDVAVVMQCEHLCAKMRGVKAFQSVTRTSSMKGKFRNVDALRQEFLALANTRLS